MLDLLGAEERRRAKQRRRRGTHFELHLHLPEAEALGATTTTPTRGQAWRLRKGLTRRRAHAPPGREQQL